MDYDGHSLAGGADSLLKFSLFVNISELYSGLKEERVECLTI